MILGAALTICSTLLYLEAYKNKSSESKIETEFVSWKNLFVCALISCIYALILVGWLSFYLATVIYITFFILYFSREELLTANLRKKTIIIAFTVGPLAAISISALFRYGFLVRLP